MLRLLKTFVDIIAIRKGPDSVPGSWIVLSVAFLLMLLSSYAVIAVAGNERTNYVNTFVAYSLGIVFYAAIIFLAGHSARMLASVSSIIACGAIVSLLFVAELALFTPLFGVDAARQIAYMIILWSVPVEGHIMARTIDRSWLAGTGIAIVALFVQVGLQSALDAGA